MSDTHHQYTKVIERKLFELHATKRSIKQERARLKRKNREIRNVERARQIAQTVAQSLQQKAHQRIAGIVSLCLQTVFSNEYDFRIDFVMKRGRTEAQLILIKDDHDITDPMNEDSGGVVEVASFALRIACLMLTKPHVRKLVVLDEPFGAVAQVNRPQIIEMVQTLAKDLDMQVIMVTHISDLEMGKVVRINKSGKVTYSRSSDT